VGMVPLLLQGILLVVGVLLLIFGNLSTALLLKLTSFFAGGLSLVAGASLVYATLRPNNTRPDLSLPLTTTVVVNDGLHNAFTDLVVWREALWMAFIASPSHFASRRSRVVVMRSLDGRQWQECARLDGNGEDIRDPKLAVVQNQLFLYALHNKSYDPQPYQTICSHSQDGANWHPLEFVHPGGWLLGKPKSLDGATWYVPAHRIGDRRVVLLRSQSPTSWDIQATIHQGEQVDETAIEILPDGRMVAVTRLEVGASLFGHPECATLISEAYPPYQTWKLITRSRVTRLDGPCLFQYNGRLLAVGRYQPQPGAPFHLQGSVLSRKRTSLFLVGDHELGLMHLFNLPACGDTAYAGAVQHNGMLYLSYYTSDTGKDYPWIMGMFYPTRINISSIALSDLSSFIEKSKRKT